MIVAFVHMFMFRQHKEVTMAVLYTCLYFGSIMRL
jgi:hypothetical protein